MASNAVDARQSAEPLPTEEGSGTDHLAIIGKATDSIKWSALIELVSRSVSPAVFLVLARLLAPADFGVFAIALMAIAFTQIFWEAGLGRALVQTRESVDEAADAVFWINLALSLVLYAVLFAFAPAVALFFGSEETELVLRVLSVQVLIGALAVVPQALFVRDLGFRELFKVRLATALVPAFFSISLAIAGYGIWALVSGALVGSALNLAMLWKRSCWRPRLRVNWPVARALMPFGAWVAGESMIGWFFLWGDSMLVGRYFGPDQLGVYTVAMTLATLLFGIVLNPLLPVLYPTLSRLQEDRGALRAAFLRVNRIVAALALPMGTGLLLLGPLISSALFGAKWYGLGFVLSAVGLMHGITWLVGINADLYRSMGRPDATTKLMALTAALYLPAYLFAAPLGFEAFTIVRLAVAVFLGVPLQAYVCSRLLGLGPLYLWYENRTIILATVIMSAIVSLGKVLLDTSVGNLNPLVSTGILVAIGSGAYGYALSRLDRPFVVHTLNLGWRAVGGRTVS